MKRGFRSETMVPQIYKVPVDIFGKVGKVCACARAYQGAHNFGIQNVAFSDFAHIPWTLYRTDFKSQLLISPSQFGLPHTFNMEKNVISVRNFHSWNSNHSGIGVVGIMCPPVGRDIYIQRSKQKFW